MNWQNLLYRFQFNYNRIVYYHIQAISAVKPQAFIQDWEIQLALKRQTS